TTFRLMAEKMCNQICTKLNNTTPCRTAEEPLVEEVPQADKDRAKKFFPSYGVNLAATRLGVERFKKVVERLESEPESRELVCECENVTRAEVEEICKEDTSFIVNDVRRRTRIGMGTCQGNFCALRAAAVFADTGVESTAKDSLTRMKEFLQGRWKGIRPVLLGRTLRETEMTRVIYELSMAINNAQGGMNNAKNNS
ncbi:MAG: (2Fe-2S)-binding protein, partial [Selenomonadaceae bacterium]|nr:(2Fe-2S)-binding protein [Selenomonadaceae bacterium]